MRESYRLLAPVGAVAVIACGAGNSPLPQPQPAPAVTPAQCPAGTTYDGTACVAGADTSCPGGSRFVAGQGCMGNAATPPASAEPAPVPAPVVDAEGMVSVPAATVWIGSATEPPRHRVGVAAFHIDATEVTVASYAACVRAKACARAWTTAAWSTATDDRAQSAFCNGNRADRQNHPVNCVDWNQATAYCTWAHKRLPTEEEWEYAARGTDGRTYPWGNDERWAERTKVYCGNGLSTAGTCPVGSLPAGDSPFGLHDMAGNVWEWTSSGSSRDYNDPPDDRARVIRGGNWTFNSPSDVHAAGRQGAGPSSRAEWVGLRCVRSD